MMNTTLIHKQDYFGFVYRWYDKKRQMYYVGSHSGSLTSGYKGSNVRFQRAIKKRPEDFTRTILEFVTIDNKRAILDCEQKWLDLTPNIKDDPRYYNKKNEACGGWSHLTKKSKLKQAKSLKKRHRKSGLSKKEKDSYKTKIKSRLDRIADTGFTEKEKAQHASYGVKIQVTDASGVETIFNSCSSATRVYGVDTLYGLKVCQTRDNYKGLKIIKLADPIVDCRGIK